MLTIRSVTKRFGELTALDCVDLRIEAGEFFGLLGPNGAGKSTLMSLIAGLRCPERGELSLDGEPLRPDASKVRKQIGFVPQALALYQDLSPEQNLRIFGQLYGLSGKDLEERIGEALAAAKLEERRRDLVKTFSGGMQRRLNIVASLLHKPKLLLCDEPTVGVDPQSRNAIFDYLQELNRGGVTVIYSTHYMEEAERLCPRIGIIDHGKILALGKVDELISALPFEDKISFPNAEATAALVDRLREHGTVADQSGTWIFSPNPDYPLSAFYALTESAGCSPRLFESRRPSLEDVFLHLTGRRLRE